MKFSVENHVNIEARWLHFVGQERQNFSRLDPFFENVTDMIKVNSLYTAFTTPITVVSFQTLSAVKVNGSEFLTCLIRSLHIITPIREKAPYHST